MNKNDTNRLIKGIYIGLYSTINLPEFVFEYTFTELMETVDNGFNAGLMTEVKAPIYANFKKNINHFSGAKTVSETWTLQKNVFAKDGTKRAFTEFTDIATQINSMYNSKKHWLGTEQNTAFAQAQSADRWVRTQEKKELFPYLQYQTIGDDRVRHQHRAWDGIIRHVDDPFWVTRMPPNDWNCRCTVIRLRKGDNTNLDTHLQEVKKQYPDVTTLTNPSKIFNNNAGIDQTIFNEKHVHYFGEARAAGVPKKDNYGLGYL